MGSTKYINLLIFFFRIGNRRLFFCWHFNPSLFFFFFNSSLFGVTEAVSGLTVTFGGNEGAQGLQRHAIAGEVEWSSSSCSKNPKGHWGLGGIQMVLVSNLSVAD